MRPASVVVFVVLLGLSASSAAQPPQPGAPAPGTPGSQGQATPPRAGSPRPGEAPAAGTAVLRGVVVAADTGQPVRRAMVRAMGMGTGGVTATDEDGRFEVRDLPAGRYSLSASKGGYVAVQYGQRRPGQSGTPIEIRDGEVVEKLQLALPPGSVITGQVFDDFGDPVSGMNVTAMQYRSTAGMRQLSPAAGEGSSARTDDQGTFRLYGLAPGDYYVSAAPFGAMMAAPGMRDDTPGVARTFYPGTTNPAEATVVRVQLGRETSGVAFPLVVARMARVSGRVVNSRGEVVANATVTLMPAADGIGMGTMRAAPADAKGAFSLTNVPPGDYRLQVRPMGPPVGAQTEAASLEVPVGDGDVEGLLITTMPGGVVRGRVVFAPGTTPPGEPGSVILSLAPATPGAMLMSNPVVPVESDLTFEATGLFEPRLVMAGLRTPGWIMKAVRLNGRDVTDEPIDVGPGRIVEGIEVELTDKVASLEGVVTDDRGQPVVDATLVVFPGDPARWSGPRPRFIRVARPDPSGRYQIGTMPAHSDYRIVVVRELDDNDARDPEFLASVRDAAVRFSLAEGERRVEHLRVRPD